ncbi:MAG: hypothetical protein QF369_00700 [Dehalococcoidales bacterium]|nr:hypothetical protein [Dehalococcoidales bacterium]
MSNEELRAQTKKSAPQIKIARWLWVVAMMVIMVAALIIAVMVAGNASGYWDHSISAELNPASEGSALLAALAGISSAKLWLEPLKFMGMALLLTGIGLALATIIPALRWQSNRLWDLLSSAK